MNRMSESMWAWLEDCASDAAKPMAWPSEAQRRFATENPHWDNERSCWVERNRAAEVVESDEELVRASVDALRDS